MIQLFKIKNTLVKFSVVLMISLCFGELHAQLVTDRPDQTESSSTVGKGNLQIETGFLLGFEGDQPSEQELLAPSNLFRYGVSKGIELRLLSQFESVKIGDSKLQGISDIELGAKIQIYQKEDARTEIAFISHLLVPTGTGEVSLGNYGTINKLAVSHALSENMGLGYNVGYNYLGSGNGDITYSLVLGLGVGEKVGIYAEPFGEITDLDTFILNADAGFTYLAAENLQFDFSFGTGINHKMNYLSIGFCWKILHNES